MIFNKNNDGSTELRAITGTYYANNDFAKIEPYIRQAEGDLRKEIGDDTFSAIERLYNEGDTTSSKVELLQRAVGLNAVMLLVKHNDISHEDDGRKVKIDRQNESIPWEWQLERDDRLMMEQYYKALDELFCYLEVSEDEHFANSRACKIAKRLLCKNAEVFATIEGPGSNYLYYWLIPYLLEANFEVKKNYGDEGWEELIAQVYSTDDFYDESSAHRYAMMAEYYLAQAYALRNNRVRPCPYGMLAWSVLNGGSRGEAVSADEITRQAMYFEQKAYEFINDMKIVRDGERDTEVLVPQNDKKNKYFRL